MEVQGPGHAREPGRIERRIVGALVKGFFLRGRRGGPWPVPAELQGVPLRLRCNAGARLVGLHVPAPSPVPRGIVVLAHPDRRYASHWFVRSGWIAWLRAEGYACMAVDFAAYGSSRGGSTYFHDDLRAVLAEARRTYPGCPLHLVGLSLGSFAAINATVVEPVAALVLESPYPTFADWYDHSGGGVLPWLNALMARVFPRTARRIDAGTNLAHTQAQRILVAASPADKVTPMPLSQALFARAPAARRTWMEVPGKEHLALFEDPLYRAAILAALAGAGADAAQPNANALEVATA